MVETGSSSPLVTEYLGQFVYEGTMGGTSSLKYIITPEGRIMNSGTDAAPVWSWEYNLTDHLGNIRAVIAPTANAGYASVVQQTSYFPFGMVMSEISSFTSLNKYLYNGKEQQSDFGLNWYDYGARFYDPAIGRWHTPDMVSESYFRHSPYSYSFNNPIKYYDPNGMWPEAIHNCMIGQTFIGIMNSTDIETLKWASKEADNPDKYQTKELSYRHAMGGSAKDYNDFITRQIGDALKASDRSKGLEELGYALHAIMDNSSPTHKGFQIWNGIWGYGISAAAHWLGEQYGAYKDPANQPDIILAMQEMKLLYERFDVAYGKSTLIDEVTVTAKRPEWSKPLIERIEDRAWEFVRPNANGNTGRYNQPGRSSDQNYSDDFLKWYYGK